MDALDDSLDDRRQSAFAALQSGDFARYCLGYIPSMSGNWIRITALGYLVYDLTGDPLKLGLINLAMSIPVVILSPLVGSFVDRINRRNLLVTAQILAITLMLMLALFVGQGWITWQRLLIYAVILGAISTFDWPVRLAIIPSLVDRPLLQNAIALNASMFTIARVVGPTLAGWLIALTGMAWAFGVTALLMVPFPLVLLSLPRLKNMCPAQTQNGSGLAQLMDGYRYIATKPVIKALMLLNMIPIFLAMSYVTMAPAYVSDILHMDATALGYLMAINGLGAFIGTFSVARYSRMKGRGRKILVGMVVFSVVLCVFALTSHVWVSFITIFFLGVSFGFVGALNDTLIQFAVEDDYRGRVMSVYAMLSGIAPMGAMFVGWMATSFGLPTALAAVSVIVVVSILVLWLTTALSTIE
ncbi:MAG: MFS transporter [Thermomicrobiales bacterium]|nr:MFS transporter [Thermomicrobiales bacterium]